MPILNATYRYGTAGFRAKADEMTPIASKMAMVMARFSTLSTGAVGLVFTASHNPASDNGIKMIGSDGEMAPAKWEKVAEDIVNEVNTASDDDDDCIDADGVVLVGRDTRESGPTLMEAFVAGMQKFPRVQVIDIGLVTTPQAHYVVKAVNGGCSVKSALAMYYDDLCAPLSTLTMDSEIVVDCANGVGAVAMQKVTARLPNLSFVIINCGKGELNRECGADFLKMTNHCPSECPAGHIKLGASLDGDADRLIVWCRNETGSFKILDGDRIACLFAVFLKRQFGMKPAVVQTAYANGGSTLALRSMGICTVKTLTGVKFLHQAALDLLNDEQLNIDAAIYFESNGHGTVLFNSRHPSTAELTAIKKMINECTGDAISDLLFVIYTLNKLKWTVQEWDALYTELPSVQLKVPVANKQHFVTKNDNEEVLIFPEGLQSKIDSSVKEFKNARAFVRPSGTENCLRVYVEAATKQDAEALSERLTRLLKCNE